VVACGTVRRRPPDRTPTVILSQRGRARGAIAHTAARAARRSYTGGRKPKSRPLADDGGEPGIDHVTRLRLDSRESQMLRVVDAAER
jgi:hypothetical protein